MGINIGYGGTAYILVTLSREVWVSADHYIEEYTIPLTCQYVAQIVSGIVRKKKGYARLERARCRSPPSNING